MKKLSMDEKKYYLNYKGVMKTGWINSEGRWYYFNDSGVINQTKTYPQKNLWVGFTLRLFED